MLLESLPSESDLPSPGLAGKVKAEARRLGFELAGVTDVRGSEHAAFYRAWLEHGYHGEMGYLARPEGVARRTRPDEAWPALRSAIVLGMVYAPPEERVGAGAVVEADGGGGGGEGIIARYARGRDYHRVVKAKVMSLLRWLEAEAGRELPAARAYVDTGPVLERELATRAGLGWFGRNTMLINPEHGSYFFLAVLLVEVEIPADSPFAHDRCGTCTRCVEACPTGALLGRDAMGAPVMDATRCISYLTIENKGAIPRELRPLIGNRIYGCDICQEVCPWNAQKFVRLGREPDFAPRARTVEPSLVELLSMDEAAWDDFSRGSAMRRAGRVGFLRNVAVALGNTGSADAVPALTAALHHDDALVRGHAAWALGRIGTSEARAALAARRSIEDAPAVREEIDAALSASVHGHPGEAGSQS